MKYIKIGAVSRYFNVTNETVRRWHKAGKLVADFVNESGHLYYDAKQFPEKIVLKIETYENEKQEEAKKRKEKKQKEEAEKIYSLKREKMAEKTRKKEEIIKGRIKKVQEKIETMKKFDLVKLELKLKHLQDELVDQNINLEDK